MPYGPLPYDLALQKWRAGQEPQGQAAPYDPALPPPVNDWEAALAENDPASNGTATDAPHQGPFTSAVNAFGNAASYLEPLNDPAGFVAKKIPGLYERFIGGAKPAMAEEAAHGQGGIEGALNRGAAGLLGGATNLVFGDKLKELEGKEAADQAELEAKAEQDKANKPEPRGRPPTFQEATGGRASFAMAGAPQVSMPDATKLGFQMRGQGITDQGDANAASARLEGEYAGKHATMYDALLKEESELEGRYKGMRETVEGSRDAAFQDYQKGVEELANMKIDPGRMYKDGGIPFIMTALAGAIAGGVASGVQGGPNPFLEQFDKMLNRDINAQAANIQNKRVVNAEKQNLVQYWYGRLKDVDAAKLAAKQTSLEMFNQKLQQSLYDFKDKDSQNRIKSAMAITQQAGGENLIQYGDKMMTLAAANAANAAAVAAANAKASAETMMTQEAFNSTQNNVIHTPDGDGPAFMATSAQAAQKANEKIATATEVRSLAADIVNTWKAGGNNEELVSKYTVFADRARKLAEAGALDAGTLAERVDLFGKAKGFDVPGVVSKRWLSDPAKSVQLIQQYAESEYNLAMEHARSVSGGRPAVFVTGIPVKGWPTGADGWIPAPGVQSVGPRGREPTSFVRSGASTAAPKKKAK